MSGELSPWFERLLGLQGRAGEAVGWRLTAAWPLPPWAMVLGVAAAVGVVLLFYGRRADVSAGRRAVLTGLRLAALAVVVLMLGRWTLALERLGLPRLAVLVDDSLSMTVADGRPESGPPAAAVQSRWDRLRAFIERDDATLLHQLAGRYRLRWSYLSTATPIDAAPPAAIVADMAKRRPATESTRLGEALRRLVAELGATPPAAVVLFSDGRNTEGPTLAEAAMELRRLGVPLVAVGLGDDRPTRDVRLENFSADEVAFVGQAVALSAEVSADGYEGRDAEVVLRRVGQSGVLARAGVRLGRRPQPVRLSWRAAEAGEFDLELEAAPLEGERTEANNRQRRRIEVRREKIQVLLASAVPTYEFRYLRALLARDAAVELKTFLQTADVDHAEQDPTALRVLPTDRQKLFAFDVILLGDMPPQALAPDGLVNLAAFVSDATKAGGLAVICGPRWLPAAYRQTPLAALLPVDAAAVRPATLDDDGARLRPTPLARFFPGLEWGATAAESEAAWRGMPPLYWMLEAARLKPAARTLVEATSAGRTLPLVVNQYVGGGRVLLHLSDESWRWRWRDGERHYDRYWLQAVRWLARSKLSAGQGAMLSADRRQYAQGDEVRLRAVFEGNAAASTDAGAAVLVEAADRPPLRVILQRTAGDRLAFESRIDPLPPGQYRARLVAPAGATAATEFSVVPPAGEFADTSLDAAGLTAAAKATLGRYLPVDAADDLAAGLPGGRAVALEPLPSLPLWNRWPALLSLVALLAAEWTLRRRSGLN